MDLLGAQSLYFRSNRIVTRGDTIHEHAQADYACQKMTHVLSNIVNPMGFWASADSVWEDRLNFQVIENTDIPTFF